MSHSFRIPVVADHAERATFDGKYLQPVDDREPARADLWREALDSLHSAVREIERLCATGQPRTPRRGSSRRPVRCTSCAFPPATGSALIADVFT